MSTKVSDYLTEKIVWQKKADPKYLYVAEFEGEKCVVRLNVKPPLMTSITCRELLARLARQAPHHSPQARA